MSIAYMGMILLFFFYVLYGAAMRAEGDGQSLV